jgi:apolipoprotein D and lipocalin family protein
MSHNQSIQPVLEPKRNGFSFTRSALLGTGLLVGLLCATGCSSTMKNTTPESLATVQSVDLDRYMGRWHVIAYTPNFFEDGKVATSDNYVKHPDGTMDADYVFRRKNFDAPEKTWHGKAWVTNTHTNAEWKVRLFWPFTSDYLILELDANYRWAVVAANGGKLVWVLSRERTLRDATYTDLLKRIDARGLDSSRLARVPQPAS